MEVQRALKEAIQLEPNAADVHVAWGDFYFALDRLTEADSMYRAALALAPEHHWAHLRQGNVRFKQADFAAAARFFERQLTHNRHSDVWHNLGSAYMMLGYPDSAQTAFENALSEDRGHSASLLGMAQLFEKEGQLDEAVRFARQAHAVAPRDISVMKRLGLLQQQLAQNEEAVETLRPVVLARPWDYQAHYSLGRAYQALGEREAAAALLSHSDTLRARERVVLLAERRAAQQSNDLRAQVELAQAYDGVGRVDEAISAYERARVLAPQEAAVTGRMAQMLHRHDRADDASALYEEALRIDSLSFPLWVNAALAYADAERFDQAESALRVAERLRPNTAEVARISDAVASARRDGPR